MGSNCVKLLPVDSYDEAKFIGVLIMEIVSCNIQGLGEISKHVALKKFLQNQNPELNSGEIWWKHFNLSPGGRLTLNEVVLFDLPIYYINMYSFVVSKVMRPFLWEGRNGSKINHLMKWDWVSLDFGGLLKGIWGYWPIGLEISSKW